MRHKMERATLILVLGAMVAFSACHKANVASTVPPPPSPAAPTATLIATPSAIEKGQTTSLTWETANASEVSLDVEGAETLGSLQPKGSMQVTPSDSTTYVLYAKGPGGKESASARVTVTVPAPPPPSPTGPSEDELFAQNVKDVYFDFDKADLRSDQQNVLEQDALFLRQHSKVSFTVEGHCDERGSTEYNLALGAKRADAVKEELVAAGVNPENVKTMSYGKEKPVCDEHDESCWHQNRRGHLSR